MVRTTENEKFSSIKGGEHHLGFAFPGDLFIELLDIHTQTDFDAAVDELNSYQERKCWLITTEGDETQKSIAQATGFFWLYNGVWYRSNFND